MNILFLDWKCFLKEDTIKTMEELGHKVFPFIEEHYEERTSKDFHEALLSFCEKNNINLAFSYNFFPSLAEGCKEMNMPYVSFLYDSPYVKLFSFTLMYPTNTVYVFDSSLAEFFQKDGIDSLAYTYANYVIARKLTSIERINYLTKIGTSFPKKDLKLYTLSQDAKIKGFKNMGIIGYDTDMIHAFRGSKINLNISLRSIINGIPLRAMDILASGGFLLSNYQLDLDNAFTSGEDYDYFDSGESLIEKIDYYLSHENEKREIAENGYRKAKENYSIKNIFTEILARY